MRSDVTEMPRPTASASGSGWTPFGATGAMQGWPGVLGGPLGVFPTAAPGLAPPHPVAAPPASVVSLAERRESEAQRPSQRRVPDEDIVTLDRATVGASARPAPRDEILDLAQVAMPDRPEAFEPSSPIPFRRSPQASDERMRRILYLTAAGIIMATGAIYTYKTSNAPRVISVPDAISPTNRVT